MKPTDVLVVGNGLAGLIAALVAASRGKSVRVAARGAGSLAISGGSVDVLGYVDGEIVRGNPLDALDRLPEDHPYRLVGRDAVAASLDVFTSVCQRYSLDLCNASGENRWIPTILGTFKPTWLCPDHADRESLAGADTILIPDFPWLKDCHAGMALDVLRQQKRLKNKRFALPRLSPPFGQTHRNLTPLDTARYVDGPEGERWLRGQLELHAAEYAGPGTAILLPPVLGIGRSTGIRQRLSEACGCRMVEMASTPPAVAGLRIRDALMQALREAGVQFMENTLIVEARTQGGRCLSLVADAPDRRRPVAADSFIIASGGFFGGGCVASPGAVREAIFDLDLGAPTEVEEWTAPDVFQAQPFARLGVRANSRLNPVDPNGDLLLDNVFFAGRTLGGYDYVLEKSGHGVALATGYQAGMHC